MKSKANLKSHPIHPMLVAFPIAFFMGTMLFDLLGMAMNRPGFVSTARYLNIVGIIAALVTAIPGIVDYFYTVPPQSSAKTRATKHGLTNITVVALFSAALWLRYHGASHALIIGIELVACVLLSIAGWLGGTLVYRNQIGVDIRYADAGKWKEDTAAGSGRIKVAAAGELKTNQMKLLHVNGKRMVLARAETGYVAFDDRCPHKGGSLAAGTMICNTVQCPWHGSQFDVTTGALKAGPAKEKIATYKVVEDGNDVFLIL